MHMHKLKVLLGISVPMYSLGGRLAQPTLFQSTCSNDKTFHFWGHLQKLFGCDDIHTWASKCTFLPPTKQNQRKTQVSPKEGEKNFVSKSHCYTNIKFGFLKGTLKRPLSPPVAKLWKCYDVHPSTFHFQEISLSGHARNRKVLWNLFTGFWGLLIFTA